MPPIELNPSAFHRKRALSSQRPELSVTSLSGGPERPRNLIIERWQPDDIDAISGLENKTWAPWLRKPKDIIRTIALNSERSATHFLAKDPNVVVGILSATRTDWDGNTDSLKPWDAYAGGSVEKSDYPKYEKKGNTIVIMSSSVDPDHQGKGIARALFEALKREARESGIKHIVAPIRPSDYGIYMRNRNNLRITFAEYCEQVLEGKLEDNWLNAARHMGMKPLLDDKGKLRIEESSMRVKVPFTEFLRYRARYRPHKDLAHPNGEWEEIDGKWYSGETGSWTVGEGEAEYVESNLLCSLDTTA